jgi:arginyl-tRNA synthetase
MGKGMPLPDPAQVKLPLLALPVEVALARRLAEYPEILEGAIRALEPHRITYYLHDLAGEFHSYYNDNRILIEEDPELAAARLVLAQAVGMVLTGGLSVLGVSAPEVM